MTSPIIILGAGAAGLTAARTLVEAGKSPIVVEARDRIGGRIHTIHDPLVPIPVELGAEFIHGQPESTWKLLHESGLPAYDLPFEHWQRRGRKLVQAEDYLGQLSAAMRGLPRLRKDMPFAEYLRTHHADLPPIVHKAALDFVGGFDAADPQRISAKSIAGEIKGMGEEGGEMQYRLLTGYSSLMDFLAYPKGKKKIDIRFNVAVKDIRWKKSSVEILCRSGARQFKMRASRVICTLPLGLLQLPDASTDAVRFVPDLAEKRAATARLGFGSVVKVIFIFRRAFWEDRAWIRAAGATNALRDASFLHDMSQSIPTWWTMRPFRVPMLTGWAGGPRADALHGCSESHVCERGIASLAAIFRRRPHTIRELLRMSYVIDWAHDPFARGAYSYECIGGHRARQILAQSVQNTLFFAGEGVSTQGVAGTVAGAISTGERAARESLASL
ncbi:MAG TPA: NAD(P)/FAD-dependent oxidoreductase [Phycisphaerales bacterium]|nr:NAD(P)/FAD-dependent oxidoreductase [Phycisphaerales bacterium]